MPTDVGYRDFSYGSSVSAPTGQKPQSKLWVNDGTWWGALYSTTAHAFTVHRLDWATQEWSDTGVEIDPRTSARLDVMWDGSHLYTIGAGTGTSSGDSAELRRFSYSPGGGYVLDAGFPVVVVDGGMEAGVFDKDSTGVIWFTYTRGNATYVTHSTTDDLSWGTPFVIPVAGADTLDPDDISAVVAYDGKIGVMWSNQTDSTMYFATHADGAPTSQWTVNPAVQLPEYADDHLNLKSLQADADGRVYAATKTSLNAGNAPLMLLLVLDGNGSWQRHTVATVAENHTRPLVLIDQENRQLYWFAASPCCSGGTIYYKQTSLDNISFAPGLGTPFIESSTDVNINNISSTKQALDSSTGLVAIASDDHTRYYLHNAFSLAPPGGPPDTTITSGPSGDVSVDTASFSFVSTVTGSSFECSLDGAPAVSCTSPTTYTGLALGSHTFDVAARDPAGQLDPSPAHADWNVVDAGDVVTEVDIRIAASIDDAEEWESGDVNLDSSDLELVDDSGRGNQAVGMRFPGLTIPPGATITDAWIQFQVDEASSGGASLVISAQDADSAEPFSSTPGTIRSRPRTTSTVAWSPPGWPTVGAAGAEQRTPPLTAVLQSLIDRPGWAAGNAAAFIVTGSGTRWAEAFDGDPSGAPLLHVAYSSAPPDPPTISAVSPTSGPPGTLVTIDGSDLGGASAVAFNGTAAPYTVVSSSQITATVPGGATTGPLSVTGPGGTTSGPDFTVTPAEPSEAIRVPADQPTIQAAIDVAVDDDVILVAPGTYHESVVISGKTITLASQYYESSDPSLIESTVIDTNGSQDAIVIQDTTGAGPTIQGLKLVKGSTSILDGIRVEGSARLLDLHIVGFDDGVDLDPLGGGSSICECLRNLIELGTDDGFDLDGAAGGVFEQNILRNNHEDGIEVRLSDTAGLVEMTFRDNEISGNGQDGIQIIDLLGASNRVFTIERNLIVDNGRAGIGLMDNAQSGEDYRAASLPDRINLFNNTFSGNDHGMSGGDNVIGLNNIFEGSSAIGVKGVDGGSLLAYSTFWNNGTDASGSNLDGATTQQADPLLAADFSLSAGSPAIDAGVATYDFGGETVLDLPPGSYSGSAPDHGALEFTGSTGPPSPTISQPSAGETITTRTFTVRGTAPGAVRVRLLVDGSERASTAVGSGDAWATVVNGLADGPHTLATVAVDAADNQSAASADLAISVAVAVADPVVAAAGDIACDRTGTTDCRQMATSDLLLDGTYDAVLSLGDHQYECGSSSEFAVGYDPSWGRVKPITRPTVGNHEYFTDRGVDCDPTGTASGYFDYFGAAAGTQGEGWYSYDLGGWHLVALNSNCAEIGGCGAGSAQEQWLQADLAASGASCTLAYWHHPRWSSGSVHGSDAITQALVDALYANGAELLLAGHDHDYERFAPQAPDGTSDADYGLRQFVVGTGGRSVLPFGTVQPNSEARAATDFGVLSLTLHDAGYSWSFLTTSGSTLDSGTADCHGDPGSGDTTPPQTTIGSGPADPSASADASFTLSSSEAGSTFECALDGAAFSACTSPATYTGLADGSHGFAARATDTSGNTDPIPAAWGWTIDTTAPSVTSVSPADGATGVDTTTLVTATLDEPVDAASLTSATFTLAANAIPVPADVSLGPAANVVTLTPASALGELQTYTARLDGLTDRAGNPLAITTWSFTTAGDTTPPETTIDSGPGDPSLTTAATFTLGSSESGSTFECSLDGAAFAPCASPASYTDLADGPHTFAARATDAAGNTDPTPATSSWTIDATAPSVSGVSPVDGATDVPLATSVTATFDEAMAPATVTGSTFRLTLAGSPIAATVNYNGNSHVATLTPSAPLGYAATYVATVDGATDAAGNPLPVTTWSFTTVPDTTPPQTSIGSGPADPSSSADASFTFSSSEAGSTFECALDGAAFGACTSPASYTGLADGSHGFSARATDAAGNTDPTPATWSWTIDTSVPPAPVSVTFNPNADAHVRQAAPTANYGSSTTLLSDAVDGGGAAEANVRFNVSGVSGTVQRAVLRIWVTNKSNNGPSVYRSDAAWSEASLDWTTRPARLGGAVATAGAIATGWYEYDVTSALSGDGLFSFTLVPTSSDGLDFSSREGSVRPQLVITYLGGDDTTPPQTTIQSGPPDPSSSGSATFAFISNELGSSFACSLDGAPFAACTSPTQYTGLSTGPHGFSVRATDASGNADPTPATWSWTIVTATSGTFSAGADTLADERRSTSNFGTTTTLESDGDSGRSKQAFLRFDVSGATSTIVSAKIRIWVTNATTNGPEVFSIGSGWVEGTLTWANRPLPIGPALVDAGSIASGAWYEFDVTPAVTGNGTYSFVFVSASTDALKFASRETTTPPQLVVVYGS